MAKISNQQLALMSIEELQELQSNVATYIARKQKEERERAWEALAKHIQDYCRKFNDTIEVSWSYDTVQISEDGDFSHIGEIRYEC